MTKDTKNPERATRGRTEPSRKISLNEIFDSPTRDKLMTNNSERLYDSAVIEKLRAAAKIGNTALQRGDFEEFDKAVKLAVDLLDEI